MPFRKLRRSLLEKKLKRLYEKEKRTELSSKPITETLCECSYLANDAFYYFLGQIQCRQEAKDNQP